MSVRHALLALLNDRNLSGYDLKTRFDRLIGELWQLNSGQIYTTLERLHTEGLVNRKPAPVVACPDRSLYSITLRGRDLMQHWFTHPYLLPRPFRDPVYIRLALTPLEHRDELLLALDALKQSYQRLHESVTPLLANFPLSPSARARWLVLDAARMQIETEIKWLCKVEDSLRPCREAVAS